MVFKSVIKNFETYKMSCCNNRKAELLLNIENTMASLNYFQINWKEVMLDSATNLKELIKTLHCFDVKLSIDEKTRLEKVIPIQYLRKPSRSRSSLMTDNDELMIGYMTVGLFCLLTENDKQANEYFTLILSYAPLSYEVSYYKSLIKSLPLEERLRYAYFSILEPSSLYYYNLFTLLFNPNTSLLIEQNKQSLIFLKKEIELDETCIFPNIHCMYIDILFKLFKSIKSLSNFRDILSEELYLDDEAIKRVRWLLKHNIEEKLNTENSVLFSHWANKYNFELNVKSKNIQTRNDVYDFEVDYNEEWRKISEDELDKNSDGFWRWNID